MIQNLSHTQNNSEPGAFLDRRVPAGPSRMDDVLLLASAPQRRTGYLAALLRDRLNWRARPGILVTACATALVSVALVIAYTTLLAREGVPASAEALSAVLLAATLSSVAGFAFSAVCGAMLMHIMSDPVQVVVIMMVCSIAIQSLSVAMLWRDIDWKTLLRFLTGGVVGLPLGIWLLLHLGNVWFKEAIGGLLMAYAAYGLLMRPLTVRSDSRPVDACVGFLGGITGGLAGFPGAAVTIWCAMKG